MTPAGAARRKIEQVWVVPRETAFSDGAWRGIRDQGVEEAVARFERMGHFRPRQDVEEDPAFQQIATYIVFRHAGRYFLTKRLKASTERRLHHLYSLGVGGHINPPDAVRADPIHDGLWREWQEEIEYPGRVAHRLVGLIKDDSTPVGQVHLGLFFLLEGDRYEIGIRETGKLQGALLSLEEMRAYYLDMESWSQLVYDYLVAHEVEIGQLPLFGITGSVW